MTTITTQLLYTFTLGSPAYLTITANGDLAAGLVTLGSDSVVNSGSITGVFGGQGGAGANNKYGSGGNGDAGGSGTFGADLTATSLTNIGTIIGGGGGGYGGAGGVGRDGGGAGGAGGNGGLGVILHGGSVLNNTTITGGYGNHGGPGGYGGYGDHGRYYAAGNGGAGGNGGAAAVVYTGTLANYGLLWGGPGGIGGDGSVARVNYQSGSGGAGGTGGTGADVYHGMLVNAGTILGGRGLPGGSGAPRNGPVGIAGPGGAGGQGGYGVVLSYAILKNTGTIQGGASGNGGAGFYGGLPAATPGGAGLLLDYGLVSNYGGIFGNAPGYTDHYGIIGRLGDGVDILRGGNVNNASTSAVISGYVGVKDKGAAGGTTVTDRGVISGQLYSVEFTHASDRLIVQSGARLLGKVAGGGGTLELSGGAGTATELGGGVTLSAGASGVASGFVAYAVTNSGSWTLNGGVDLLAGRRLTVYGGATAVLYTPTVFNAGTIALNGGTSLATLVAKETSNFLGEAVADTLTGGGVISLNGRAVIRGVAGDFLENVDNTIQGGGWIGLSNLSFINDAKGVVESLGNLVVNTKGFTLWNTGLIEAASTASLEVQNSLVDQTSGGTIAALSGGKVFIEADTIKGGTLSQAGTGLMRVNMSGSTLEGSVAIVGALQVSGGVALTLDGTLNGGGQIDLLGGAGVSKLMIGADGESLTGAGQIVLTASINNQIVSTGTAATLTNVSERISGGGVIGDANLSLVNQKGAIIGGTTAATLTLNTGAHTILNAGAIQAQSTGQVTILSPVANTGVLFAASGTLNVDGAVTGSGTGQISKGMLNIAGGFAETVTFVAGATGTLRLTDYKDFTGTVKGFSTTGTNAIQIAGMAFVSGKSAATFTGTTSSGVLTITNGTVTAKVTLMGDYLGHTFTVTSGGAGISTVKDPPAVAAPLVQALAAHTGAPDMGAVTVPRSPTHYWLALALA